MEAAARTAYYLVTGENASVLTIWHLEPVRGMEGVREATVEMGGLPIRLAVIHGTENARTFIEQMKKEDKSYDFIEVMTCKGGCIGGGGQPKDAGADDG